MEVYPAIIQNPPSPNPPQNLNLGAFPPPVPGPAWALTLTPAQKGSQKVYPALALGLKEHIGVESEEGEELISYQEAWTF